MRQCNIHQLQVGSLSVNCFIVFADGSESCAVIDPGGDAQAIAAKCGELGVTVDSILLTHAHFDHIGGTDELVGTYSGVKVVCHELCDRQMRDTRFNGAEMFMMGDVKAVSKATIVDDGEIFSAGGLAWRPFLINGHMDGQLVFYAQNAGVLFSGDTVFRRSIGRSDFPGGDAKALLLGLDNMLRKLPPQTVVFPGHGESTTVGEELEFNPFLRRDGKFFAHNTE